MIELNTGQLLALAMGVDCAAMTLIAGVFFLVVRATPEMRGRGWVWSFALFAAGLGVEALARVLPAQALFLSAAGTVLAVATAYCTVRATFDFARVERVPSWALAILSAAAVGSLVIVSQSDAVGGLLAPELVLMPALAVTAIVLYPIARSARTSGVQTACAIAALLTIMMVRTLVSGAILGLTHRQLNPAYWVIELVGAGLLAFILAMGEIVAMLEEIHSELQEANSALGGAMENLEVAAKMDPLTGLYNRYAFHTVVAELRRGRPLDGSIVVLDLNGLKRINDTFGHYAGDRALRNVARRLQEMVRSTDYVFRWGGDEFVLLLFDVAPEVARDRLAHMEPPEQLQLHGRLPVDLSVSWGVAPLAYDVEGALKEADAQLYHQRRLIRNAAEKLGPV